MRVLLFVMCLLSIEIHAQCIPDSIYLDSLPGTYPQSASFSTTAGSSFYEKLDIHIPSNLIEATNGDSSQLLIDTLGQTIYVGEFSIDSMQIIEIQNLPDGIGFSCNISNCIFQGGDIGCIELFGSAKNTGFFNTIPTVNYFISGIVNINAGGVPLIIPVEFDYYSYFGEYVTISGYTIEVIEPTSISTRTNKYDINYIQANDNLIEIEINSKSENKISITIIDLQGKELLIKGLNIIEGTHKYIIEKRLTSGFYFLKINNQDVNSYKFYVSNI